VGRIIVLDENTSNKIAAGEVVEKPASVVKELVENSIDAGANSISIDIKNGGISYIKVTDNGSGMDEDDVEIAFERHATSKIKKAEDLDSIVTMGFRGEALASIAAVASVELQTKTASSKYGMYVHISGGVLQDVRQTGCHVGTMFIIKDLFYNTPARYKFLKKDSTEAGYISDSISRIALGNPGISFKLTSGKTELLHTPGNNDLKSTIFSIYGKEIVKELMLVDYQDEKVKISGYVGKPESARSNRNYQSLFINKRYVKSKFVSYAVEQAYNSILMKNKFPFYVLNIDINPLLVDANVHPAKIEVRFADESHLSRAIYMAVSKALSSGSLFNPVTMANKDRELFKFTASEPKNEYIQQQINYQIPNDNKNQVISDKKVVDEPVETLPSQAKYNVNNFHENSYIKEKATLFKNENSALENKFSPSVYPSQPIQVASDPPAAQIEQVDQKIRGFETLTEMKYIGQAFSTYIILQSGEELVLVDQHAAHERILYEKLKTKFESQENNSQLLLEPVVIQLQAYELNIIKIKEDLLNNIGFIFEDFGNNSIIIRGVPYLVEGYSPKELFLELTDKMNESVKPINTPLADEIIHTIACKAAIKANKKLDDKEVQQLLTELSITGRKYTCPHGRPTVIRLTKYEIEKMFKRIV
jgi:DNA mismatch repair protein MutL